MLLCLGWDVETAKHAKLDGKINDTIWLIYSRKNERIGITCDELKAEQGEEVSRELRKHGGKIIRINGSQNEYHLIGKLLYHYPCWYKYFVVEKNNGVSVISELKENGCINYSPVEYHQHFHQTDAIQFNEYLEKRQQRKKLPIKHRKSRKTKPEAQPDLM
jgi:hypothetical protein